MIKFKYYFLFFIFLINFKGESQSKAFSTAFYFKGKRVKNVKYYIIKKDFRIDLISQKNDSIFLNNVSNNFKILAIYKNHKVIIPMIRINEISYIKIYFDNRIFNNLIRKKYREPFFKYFLKKNYLIDIGLEDVFVTFKPKHKYIISSH